MEEDAFRLAIARGVQPGGDLDEELSDFYKYTIRSREDALAICEALKTLPFKQTNKDSSPLHDLVALFQNVEGGTGPAYEVLANEGIPQLIRIFDAEVEQAETDEEKASDLVFMLKIFAMYHAQEGAERVVEAAKRRLESDHYLWHMILETFAKNHPQSDDFFEKLSDPLPEKFTAVALADSANTVAGEGRLKRHPFDSEAGWKRLQNWIEGRNPSRFSYAHSAVATLPFISNPARDRLLDLAMDHVDPNIQTKAAHSAAKLGRGAGFEALAKFCKDVNHSDSARQYLAALDREDLIPAEAKDPSFAAKADFVRWLAHPHELGQPPDELEIVDHRQLTWPPELKPRPFWLIRYRLRDKTGLADDDVDCGLVGGVTFCLFSYHINERPPEDAYAIHCYWEMKNAKLIEEEHVDSTSEYQDMLGQWEGARLVAPMVTWIAKISEDLKKVPARLMGVATANLNGKEGWVVLDGPRSKWYPADEQRGETGDTMLLKIHIGRQLLDFRDEPDRKKYLAAERPPREPRQIVEAYEKLMAEVFTADGQHQAWILASHFDAYVKALAAVYSTSEEDAFIDAYGRLVGFAERTEPSDREEICSFTGPLAEHFDKYVDGLVSRGRAAETARLIPLFAPHWRTNGGDGALSRAAFHSGQRDLAEKHLSKVREEDEDYFRYEEMGLLAEVWRDRGEADQARELLVDCMRKLITLIEEAEYESDERMYSEEFEAHRSTYLRLFPDSESDLTDITLPQKGE